jgi:hypothetical protein
MARASLEGAEDRDGAYAQGTPMVRWAAFNLGEDC